MKVIELDLRKEEKVTMKVILPNGEQVEVLPPSKGLSDQFAKIGEAIVMASSADLTIEEKVEAISFLYGAAADLMSRNTAAKQYTKEYLEQQMATNQIVRVFETYSKMLKEVILAKN